MAAPSPKKARIEVADCPAPKAGVDWAALGFGLTTRDTTMVCSTWSRGTWSPLEAMPFGEIKMTPAATILNYGQGIFEGVKAHRTHKGRIVIFRPEANADRFEFSAKQFLMPSPSKSMFMEALRMVVQENGSWVPPAGQGSLYIRPILFGSGPDLGVQPSSEYRFIIYCAPVGDYFSGKGASLEIMYQQHRAASGGVGHIKCVGNYAPCFEAQRVAKAAGFSDVLYLNSNNEFIEEAAASNFFCITRDGELLTPELGSILPGVTRDSVLRLARHMLSTGDVGETGLRAVRECQVSVSCALSAAEAFLTGTGAGIVPIKHLQPGLLPSRGKDFEEGALTKKIGTWLSDIKEEKAEDIFGWLYDPFAKNGK